VTDRGDFDVLIAEAAAVPVDGWDFSWLDGRATEERPPWGYARSLVPRISRAGALLDVQTGGGEVLAEALAVADPRPDVVAATESWPPNLAIARGRLEPFGGSVAEVADAADLPFATGTFDLVTSRHPVCTRWDEIARVLATAGSYFAQHVGSGSNHELTDFLMGPQPIGAARTPERAVADATAVGLEVVDVQQATMRVEFFDVGAVVYFLRKVIWTVPDFDVDRYRDRLRALHERIRDEGVFVSTAPRFLIELRRPER
jgi:SAM-dependent methyltransferase